MINKFKLAMIGGRGYVGQEVISILNNHPNFELEKVFSKSTFDTPVKGYKKSSNLTYSKLENTCPMLDGVHIVVMALANNESKKYVHMIEKNYPNIIFIDISSDHRFDTKWSYRIPELSSSKATNFISNPGCYASAIQFSLEPIKKIISGRVSSFGISGYSGAGASPNDKNNPDKLENNVIPYSLSGHTHELEVARYCYQNISFSPHVGNFFRGILITSHIKLIDVFEVDDILSIFKNYYKESPLISVLDEIPMINDVANKHVVHVGGITLDKTGENLTVCCALDNLLKGAATQTIQNLNSACGLSELTGLNYE